MKALIQTEELFPMYTVTPEGDPEFASHAEYEESHKCKMGNYADVDQATVERWKRVMSEFEVVQEEMMKEYEKAGGNV